ncbi:MAG: YcxB family protein [Geitlerinemataceae cyanobacterium]
MNLEYRLTNQDYQEAYRANYQSQRIGYWLLWLVAGFLMLVGCLYVVAPRGDRPISLFLGTLSIALGIGSIPEVYHRLFFSGLWRSHPVVREPVSIEITEDWLVYHSESIQAQIQWHVYTHFLETPNLFLIYPNHHLYGVLPKRALGHPDRILEFRQFLRHKVRPPQTR